MFFRKSKKVETKVVIQRVNIFVPVRGQQSHVTYSPDNLERVFYVDVGDIPAEEVLPYIKKLKESWDEGPNGLKDPIHITIVEEA